MAHFAWCWFFTKCNLIYNFGIPFVILTGNESKPRPTSARGCYWWVWQRCFPGHQCWQLRDITIWRHHSSIQSFKTSVRGVHLVLWVDFYRIIFALIVLVESILIQYVWLFSGLHLQICSKMVNLHWDRKVSSTITFAANGVNLGTLARNVGGCPLSPIK